MTRLEARGLTFGYSRGEPVLREVSFTVDSGELLVLAGANGSGKSTLLGLLAGLWPPDAGELLVDGQGGRAARNFLRRATALLPQNIDHCLLGETGREDLALGLDLKEAGAAEELAALIRRWDLGSFWERPVAELSVGQKKKLALVAALARRPAAVLLDEPLAGLDWPGVKAALDDLARLKSSGVAAVMVTHEPALAAGLADRWLLLKNGGHLFGRDLAGHFEAYGLRPLR